MDYISVFSRRAGENVSVPVSMRDQATSWTDGGWTNSYTSWLDGGWANSYTSWSDGGWSNSK